MAVQQITAAQYAQQIKDAILARNRSYDVNVGPIPDVIINPMSSVLESQNKDILKLQSLLSLVSNGSYTYDDLVNFVANEGVKPDSGAKATVTLVFSTSVVTSTLTVGDGYPVGSLTNEETGVAITFITIGQTTLNYADRAAYFNPSTQRYELRVPAIATIGGTAGNMSADRIIKPLRPLVGFESVTNPQPSEGGRNTSTEAELIEQYLIAITGSDIATDDGTRRQTIDLFSSVQDAAIVYGNDPLLVRASTDAGAVDVWVLGSAIVSRTDVSTYFGALQLIPLINQPVVQVTQVISGANVLVEGIDYVFVKDTSGYYGSVRGNDGIKLLNTSLLLPSAGSSITITYNQNILIEQIQNLNAQKEYLVHGRDILIRAADQLDLTMSATFKVRQGYNPTTIQATIISTAQTFINGLLLNARIPGVSDGGSVQTSDIDAVVRRISGIDNFKISIFDIVGSTGLDDVAVGRNQYPRIDVANIIVVPG